jgi:hypothetical protein
MATNNNYPSYVPDDFRGLESIQEGNQRYYYKTVDGQNKLIGSIVGKRHLIIRFPEGSTIDVVPPSSVGTDQIVDGSVQPQDMSDDVRNRLTPKYDEQGEGIKLGGL